jgi:hypothetical protein
VLGEARPVKVAVLQTPQHEAAADSPDDAGGKSGRGRGILLIRPGAEDFMQRAQGQPAFRQSAVDRRDAKRQRAVRPRRAAFDAPDALLQINEMVRR